MPVRVAVAAVLVLLAVPRAASAGEYSVAACQADSLGFSTRAFVDLATRGMSIRRACNPDGPGRRGLITANVVRQQPVPRGATSMVAITAPQGTRFTTFRWAGTARRRDCRYALQLYAEVPGARPISIKNVRAQRHCPRGGRAQVAGYLARTFNVDGATRIVQRVVCVAASCSARGLNFIRTYIAQVGVADAVAPAATIVQDTPLARGEWVSGGQALNYSASDNVGVRTAHALVGDSTAGTEQRPCAFAAPVGPYADVVPCPNGPGRINVDTERLFEGTQSLVVQAHDAASNVGASAAVTVRIDNTAPTRVDTILEGGEQWRNRNEYAVSWVNPAEADRAPITAARYELCPVGPGACTGGEVSGAGVDRLGVQAPAQGEWKLSLWRRDAAGNESKDLASVPVTLRYDAEAPNLAFAPPSPSDPTAVSVAATDTVSGVADGAIEMSREGSGTWQTLPTQRTSDQFVARIDDANLTPGVYALRARARDHAGNESSTGQRADGLPMMVTLPLRTGSTMTAGVVRGRALRRSARVEFGRRVVIRGRLAHRGGRGIAGAAIKVLTAGSDQPVGTVYTGGAGHFRYTTTASMSQMLRFAYDGSPLILPVERHVKVRVPAAGSLRVSRRRVLNGEAVRFSGAVRSTPLPPSGKLVELQVRLSGRWQTFRTTRTDSRGRWSVPYRFRRTAGVQLYRFRLMLPREAGYPFAPGTSRSRTVRVTGL